MNDEYFKGYFVGQMTTIVLFAVIGLPIAALLNIPIPYQWIAIGAYAISLPFWVIRVAHKAEKYIRFKFEKANPETLVPKESRSEKT